MLMNLEELSLKTEFAGTIIIKQSNIISILNAKYAEIQKQQSPRIYNPNNPNDLDIVKFGGSSNNNYSNFSTIIPFSNSHRYFLSNNYEGLKKNEMVFNNTWLFYNGLDYGINDNLSLGGGVLFLGFGGFINFTGRGQIQINENIKIGGSYNYFMLFNSNGNSSQENNFGLLSGGITFTGKKGNITFSLANGYYSKYSFNQNTNENIPGFSLSGCYNFSDRTAIVSDNFYILNKINPRSYSIGIRLKGRNGNFDFGLMNYSFDETYYSFNTSNNSATSTYTTAFPFLAYSHKIN